MHYNSPSPHSPPRLHSITTTNNAFTMYRNLGYNDTRYNGFDLGRNMPCAQNSVHHTREMGADPAKPRSFVSSNGILLPVSFRSATESYDQPFLFLNSPAYRILPIYTESHESTRTFNRIRGFSGLLGNSADEPVYPISRFPLFKLSEEAVGGILSYLTGADLAALALVDKDCRQLARTRQFRSVWLNFSTASMELLNLLLKEGCERVARNYGSGHNRWRLGSCIRRITIAWGDTVKEVKEVEVRRGRKRSTQTWIESRMRSNAAMELHTSHINALDLVLRVAVPNLEFLDWRDRIPLTPLIVSSIIASRITKLELHSVILREDFALDLNQFGRVECRLRCLLLNVSEMRSGEPNEGKFTSSILEMAAPTLEHLIWIDNGFNSSAKKHSFGEKPVTFPKLKKLHLRWVLADDTVWSALIPADNAAITHLWLDAPNQELSEFLTRRGHIASLTHVTWVYIRFNLIPQFASFISVNPQLQSFRHEEPIGEDTSENSFTEPIHADLHRILPMFTPSAFHALTSLALVWGTPTIPPSALRSIASISTLSHLALSAGTQIGEEPGWLVDHKILRKRLRPLRLLKWFVLTRDEYAHGNKELWGYRRPVPGTEDHHRTEMMRYARLLATAHPMLEWVHLGQIPMAVTRGGGGGGPTVVALREQEDVSELLREMWGDYRVNWVYGELGGR